MQDTNGSSSSIETDKDPLFLPHRLSPEVYLRDPLIVVGLPRSGSSFLSHILSQVPDWYVFDDLYIQRAAQDLRVSDPMTRKDLDGMLYFMGWQIRARLRFGIYAIPNVTEDEVALNDAALIAAFTEQPGSWAELQEDWMRRLAARAGCSRWGYKMPGAFRQLPTLLDHYPQARFMFIMRNPYKVLVSYKFMPDGHQDGDPRRYHPIAYAIYWRMAVRCYLKYRDTLGSRLTLVQFEDLVQRPQETAERIANFLGSSAPENVSVPEKPNSSFDKARGRAGLTGLETWIVTWLAGPELEALGYSPEKRPIRAADFLDIIATTGRFSYFHLSSVFKKIAGIIRHKIQPEAH